MSFRLNAFANYLGNTYNLLIAIIIYPLYLGFVGAEAYGLISIFIMLQAIFLLLDVGLSPTLNRQAADSRARPERLGYFQQLLRSIEILLWLLIAILLLLCWQVSDAWLVSWLTLDTISIETAATCLRLMITISLLRVLATIYRSAVLGFERQVWFNGVNIFLVTLKYPIALAGFKFLDFSIVQFFEYQLLIATLELVLLWLGCYKFAAFKAKLGLTFSKDVLLEVLPFISGIAYTSLLWILVTQFDKAILSSILPLAEFGYFGLISLVASSMIQLSGPLNQALLPRLTYFYALQQREQVFDLYLLSCKLMFAILGCVALILAMYPDLLLYAWAGDQVLATWGSNVLRWYIIGYALLSLSALQYVLQVAHGNLRLHVIGSTIGTLVQLPLIYYAAVHYGALGVAMVWAIFRLVFLLLWSPIVHRALSHGLHTRWLLSLVKVASILLLLTLMLTFLPIRFDVESRIVLFLQLFFVGCIALSITLFAIWAELKLFKRKLSVEG